MTAEFWPGYIFRRIMAFLLLWSKADEGAGNCGLRIADCGLRICRSLIADGLDEWLRRGTNFITESDYGHVQANLFRKIDVTAIQGGCHFRKRHDGFRVASSRPACLCALSVRKRSNMRMYNDIILPVGVSVTHDKGVPVVFAYTGGHGRIRMKAKRFPPRALGGIEKAISLAAAWRAEALKEHQKLKAALPKRPRVQKPFDFSAWEAKFLRRTAL